MDMYSTFLNQNSKVMSSYWQSTFLYFVSFQKRKKRNKKNRYNRCASIFQNASKPPLIAPELNRLESQGRREDVSLKTEKKKKHINDILDACVPQNEDSKDASLVATAASLTVAPPQTLKQSLFRLLRKKKP